MSKVIGTRVLAILVALLGVALAGGMAFATLVQVTKTLSSGVVVMPQNLPVIAGDIDASGVVDASDLGLVAANFNSFPPAYRLADVNRDGIVDLYDLVLVGISFGQVR